MRFGFEFRGGLDFCSDFMTRRQLSLSSCTLRSRVQFAFLQMASCLQVTAGAEESHYEGLLPRYIVVGGPL